VEQIYIKDMIMSKELQTDLSMTAKTKRLLESKITSAEVDVQSAKLMR
jgi:erythrocyte band 7 integral membrane protein